MNFLKRMWWMLCGRCPECGGELEVVPVGFSDWSSYCSKCRSFFERL